ncbi:MAG TPA: hypothetical protein DD490_08460 [Acidobacteria bacterium]|nr:hypothetical protein [Acidobacteriota bacterium]
MNLPDSLSLPAMNPGFQTGHWLRQWADDFAASISWPVAATLKPEGRWKYISVGNGERGA